MLVFVSFQGQSVRRKGELDLQSRNIDHDIVVREIVQNVSIRFIPKREIPRQRQYQASSTTDSSRVMRYLREPVERRFPQRSINQQ